MTDEELVREVRSGSRAAMEMLVNRHYKAIFAYVYRKTGDYHTAYDLTQEVFVKMLKNIGQYKDKGKFYHWLLKIAVNHCTDYYRGHQYRQQHRETELDEQLLPADDARMSGTCSRTGSGTNRLKKRCLACLRNSAMRWF